MYRCFLSAIFVQSFEPWSNDPMIRFLTVNDLLFFSILLHPTYRNISSEMTVCENGENIIEYPSNLLISICNQNDASKIPNSVAKTLDVFFHF